MKILQCSYCDSFKYPLVQAVSQKEIAGMDNVSYFENGKKVWYWHVDLKKVDIEAINNIKFNVMGNCEKEAFIQRLEKLKPEECLDFDHFISMVCNQVTIDSKLLIVKGDITNSWYHPNHDRLTDVMYTFDFLDKHDLKKVKKLCVYETTESNVKFSALNDSCIKALVEVCVNPQNADIYLKAHEIKVENKCSRKLEYADLQEQYSEFIPSSPREISLSSEKPAIAVIFKEGT